MVYRTTNYWNRLLVNIDKIQEEWDQGKNYSGKLKIFLMAFDNSKKKLLVDFIYPNNNYEPDQIERHYDTILRQPNATYTQALREFYAGKDFVIEEYVANNPQGFTQLDKDNNFFALIKIFKRDPNILTNLLLMKIWNSKSIDETFLFSPPLLERGIQDLKTDMDRIIAAIKRKNKGKYEFNALYSFGKNNIFWLEKQSSDKMLRAFSKNIRFKPSSDILFNINLEDNLIELKCGNASLLNNIADILARRLSLKLAYYGKEQEVNIDLDKFKTGMSTSVGGTDQLGICEIGFNRIKLSNSSPLVIPKRSGRDIRKTLNELEETEVIDLKDIESIDYVKVIYQDSDKKIKFEPNKDGTLTLKLDATYLNRSKVEELSHLFEEQFGVPLGQEIKETDEKKILRSTFDLIFSSDIIDKVSEAVKTQLNNLAEKELIRYTGNKVYWCNSCRRTFSEVEKCPNCGGELRYCLSKTKVERNNKKILEYTKKRLRDNGFDVKDSLIQRTYRKQKKFFVQIVFEKEVFYLYFNDGEDIRNIVEYFKCSNVPIIIINNSKKKLKNFDKDIFPQNKVSNILLMEDSDFKSYFNEILAKAKEKVEDIIISSADNSATRLNGFLNNNLQEYNDVTLEDDAYNIMRYIFRTGEKWGKASTGLTVPEGIVGYGFLKKMGGNWNKFLRSLIWDCKFTKSDSFDFNRNAQLQARDYIMRTNISKNIKEYSRELSAYINFTNAFNETQYNNFAKSLKRIQGWNGDVVLFELKALIKLYRLMKRNFNELDKRRSQMYEAFTNLFKQTEQDKNYTLITENKINTLVNETLQRNEDIPQLNYQETFLWLKSDKIK